MPPVQTPSPTKRSPVLNRPLTTSDWLTWLLVSATVTAVLAGVGLMLFGQVQGTEFCPQTFELRRFSYLAVPYTHWQIIPATRTTITSDFTNRLLLDHYIVPLKGTARWDPCEVSSVNDNLVGLAQVLVSYLNDGHYAEKIELEAWSNNNPRRASVLWPALQEVACASAYALVPDLLNFIRQAQEPPDDPSLVQLEVEFDHFLGQRAAALADDLRHSSRPAEALPVYRLALMYTPSAELQQTYDALNAAHPVSATEANGWLPQKLREAHRAAKAAAPTTPQDAEIDSPADVNP